MNTIFECYDRVLIDLRSRKAYIETVIALLEGLRPRSSSVERRPFNPTVEGSIPSGAARDEELLLKHVDHRLLYEESDT